MRLSESAAISATNSKDSNVLDAQALREWCAQ